MATSDMTWASNVIRFPLEERGKPTLDLMRMLAPDLRTIDILAEAFGLDMPDPNLRDQVDAETADAISRMVLQTNWLLRRKQLAALLAPEVSEAVEAARAAARARQAVDATRQALDRAPSPLLEQRLYALEVMAAEVTVDAHIRAEEAEGVARAVSLATSGTPWTPRNVAADMEALLAGVG